MTHDQQSTGRKPRRFRFGRASVVRGAAVGGALCLAAGMGFSMATQASAAPRPVPGGHGGHGGVLPVCISFGGILRLALPLGTCNGPIVPLEIAGFDDHPGPGPGPGPEPGPQGISTYVNTAAVYAASPDPTNTTLDDMIATAECNGDDVATGGGFSTVIGTGVTPTPAAALPSNAVTVLDAPTHHGHVAASGDEPDGWTAGVAFPIGEDLGDLRGVTVYVVCTPNGNGGPGGGSGGGPGGGPGGASMAPAHHAARH